MPSSGDPGSGAEPAVYEAEVVAIGGERPKPLMRHQLVNQSQAAERRQQAWQLRLQGLSYREIGAQIGVSHESVGKYVNDTLAELGAASKTSAKEWRAVELARMKEMLKVWYPASLEPSLDGARAAAVALKLEERISELMGIDKPAVERETEEQELERCLMNDETMRVYAEYGVFAGQMLADLVARCGGDPDLIGAPRRTFKLGNCKARTVN